MNNIQLKQKITCNINVIFPPHKKDQLLHKSYYFSGHIKINMNLITFGLEKYLNLKLFFNISILEIYWAQYICSTFHIFTSVRIKCICFRDFFRNTFAVSCILSVFFLLLLWNSIKYAFHLPDIQNKVFDLKIQQDFEQDILNSFIVNTSH